jgi:hypothetical protein
MPATQNEIFVSITPDGYTLKKRKRKEDDVSHWEDVLKHGKTFEDLISALDGLPISFRAGAKVNYGYVTVPFPLSAYEKGEINLRVELI